MEKVHMANACGVDFGTSNSTVGWIGPNRDGGAGSVMLALEDGKATLPSVVFFNADDDDISPDETIAAIDFELQIPLAVGKPAALDLNGYRPEASGQAVSKVLRRFR